MGAVVFPCLVGIVVVLADLDAEGKIALDRHHFTELNTLDHGGRSVEDNLRRRNTLRVEIAGIVFGQNTEGNVIHVLPIRIDSGQFAGEFECDHDTTSVGG